MPDTAQPSEPLYDKRKRSHAKSDLSRLTEMRQRDHRPVPQSWKDELKRNFETNHSGKVGKPTGRMKTVCPAPDVRVRVPQTRTVGSGKADREAASKTNTLVFDRLRNEASVARIEEAMNKAEHSRKTFAKPRSKAVAAK